MSDPLPWHTGLLQCKNSPSDCLVASLCWPGIGIVQGKSFSELDKSFYLPMARAVFCCCIGTGWNRRQIRSSLHIKGSALTDCLTYALPLGCFAATQEHSEILYRRSEEKRKVVNLKPPPRVVQHPHIEIQLKSMVSQGSESSFSWEQSEHSMQERVSVGPLNFDSKKLSSDIIQIVHSGSEGLSTSSLAEPELGIPFHDAFDISHLAVDPLDGDDPLVYSKVAPCGPFSFLKGTAVYSEDSPPPTYLTLQTLLEPKPTELATVMNGLVPYRYGGVQCTDKEAIKKQSGVIGNVLGQILKNITSGLGAVAISLPVRIFEPRSACERMIDRFSFASLYLNQAASMTDPLQRFLQVMAFSVSGLFLGCKQEKPFNPLLGETFQGTFPDGTEIYSEHIRHNPPTDCIDIIGSSYRLWGYMELDGNFNWNYNALIGIFRGSFNIHFYNDNQLINYTTPNFRLGGVMKGDRVLNWEGQCNFKDNGNQLYGSLRIGDDKKKWGLKKKKMLTDEFVGKVWDYDFEKDKPTRTLSTVYGSWMKKFVAVTGEKKEKLWVADRELPVRHIPVNSPIPSDWRYREDLI